MSTPAHQPTLGAIVAFLTAPAPVIADCYTCSGDGETSYCIPCPTCKGQALLACGCGECVAGVVLTGYDDGPTFSACPNARPVTDAERDAYHNAFLARRGLPAAFPGTDEFPF